MVGAAAVTVAVAGAIVAGMAAVGGIDFFVANIRVAGLIGVRVAVSGVLDRLVAEMGVAMPIGVRVTANVAVPMGAVDSIGLGRGAALASSIGVAVGLFIRRVGVTWLSDVGTSGP